MRVVKGHLKTLCALSHEECAYAVNCNPSLRDEPTGFRADQVPNLADAFASHVPVLESRLLFNLARKPRSDIWLWNDVRASHVPTIHGGKKLVEGRSVRC